MITDSIYM